MIKKNKKVNDFELSSQIYFNEIGKYKTLSLDEEMSLWERYKRNNDLSAKETIITSNLKFVASVARGYIGRGLSYSDLIAEGNCGLLKAIEKFDYKKGYKTISYSVWWIRQAILEALKERNGIEGDELPSDFEKQNFDDDEIIRINSNEKNDCFIYDDNDDYLSVINNEKKIIAQLTENLTNREKNILIKYYGLNGVKSLTLEEIGREIGLTKERVRQILVKVFKKMRSEALKLNISDYLYE